MICEVCNKTNATCARRSPFSENLFFSCQECADKGLIPYNMAVRYCTECLSKHPHMPIQQILPNNQHRSDVMRDGFKTQWMIQELLATEQTCGIQPCVECHHLPTIVEVWNGFCVYDYLCGKVYSTFKTRKEAIDAWNSCQQEQRKMEGK